MSDRYPTLKKILEVLDRYRDTDSDEIAGLFNGFRREAALRAAHFVRCHERLLRSLSGRPLRAKVGMNVYIRGEGVLVETPSGLEVRVKGPTGAIFRPADGRVTLV